MTTGTEDYYRARAAEYDLVYDKPERQDDLRAMRDWLRPLLAGRRVLEVAAGTGYWTAVYADAAAAVVATDVNAQTLAVARGRRHWPTTVSFSCADAFDLAGVPGDFDAIIAGFFWSHVRLGDLGRFLTGVSERLAGGGIAVFMDNRYVAGSNYPLARTDSGGNTYQRRTLSDGSIWEVLKNFPSPAQVRAACAPIARTVTVTELDYYWTAVCELGPGAR